MRPSHQKRSTPTRRLAAEFFGQSNHKPGSRRSPSLRPLALFALALVTFLAFAASSAFAATQYRYEAAQSEELTRTVPGEAFVNPFGLAFDTSGNLYVADTEGDANEGIIDKFDSSNVFTSQLGSAALSSHFTRGVAVNGETGHIYVGDSNGSEVVVLDAAGNKLSQWTGANVPGGTFGAGTAYVYTAVDNAPASPSKGDVYVSTSGGNQGAGRVYVLKAKNADAEEGEFVRELSPPGGFGQLEGGQAVDIAVDQATGQVYVVDQGNKVVDRFDAEGNFEASAQITGISPTQPFASPIAVAVDPASGNVFVIDNEAAFKSNGKEVIDVFGPNGGFLTQVTEAAPNEPLKRPVALAVQSTGPNAGDLYVSDARAKQIDVFGLQPPEAPAVAAAGVTNLTSEGADLLAEIDPRGAATEYHLEYGTCASRFSCATSPYGTILPIPDASLGTEDFTTHTTPSFHISGLHPETTYHVRAVAHNAEGTTVGPDRVFTTQGSVSARLPDGRAWELVSPPDKHGAVLSAAGEKGLIEAGEDGGAIAYIANAPTEASPEGNSGEVQVLSQRAPSGWISRDIASPHTRATGNAPGTAPEYRFFAADLSQAIVQPFGLFNPALSGEASEQSAYLRTLGSCSSNCYRPLVTAKPGFANVAAGIRFGEETLCEENNGGGVGSVCGPKALDASPDASHAVLRSAAPLFEGVPRNELYEWAGGQLQLVSILPENETGEELPAPTGPFPEEQPLLGSSFSLANGPSARHAISDDGSRIFWESGSVLYMRDTSKGKTLQVDAPEAGCPEGECSGGAGRFELASADGSRVFFQDTHRLTADSGANQYNEKGHLEPPTSDLYECRIVVNGEEKLTCELTDLTPMQGGENAVVQGALLGASEDAATIYLVANGALAGTGAGRGNCEGDHEKQPASAHCNLYQLREGQAKLLAVLAGADAKDWTHTLESQPTRVSPDGRYLSFLSERPLTGYDNRDANSGQPDAEIFEYDSSGESLTCVSCDPSGARPVGVEYGQLSRGDSEALPVVRGEWESKGWVAALPPHTQSNGSNQPVYQPRYLDDSGRIFFNALGALVPADTNGIGDVYQFEPAGVGSCTTASPTYSPTSGGCADLISSGTSSQRSTFLDASESGDDVFFLTASRLTGQDVDTRQDIYDARVGGGSPSPAQPVTCQGDGCQQPAVPPNDPSPGSLTLNGAGNVLQCPRGKVKKSGKCVKKHSKKKHNNKKGKKRSASQRRGGGK